MAAVAALLALTALVAFAANSAIWEAHQVWKFV